MKQTIVNLLLITLLCNVSYSQVVINELFPDPTPAVQLPEEEFIELHNTTNQEINLSDYTISDASKEVSLPSGSKIKPNGFVIICAQANESVFTPYGDVVTVSSLPSLNNSGDEITLKDNNGALLDFVAYTSSWYQDALKKNGGWTLERINPTNFCDGQANWAASENIQGGTPGTENSIFDADFGNKSQIEFVSAWLLDTYTLELTFNKKPNEAEVTNSDSYSITPNVPIQSISLDSSGTIVTINFDTSIDENVVYNITVNNLADCAGETFATTEKVFGTAKIPAENEIIINEILFNPATGGVDFLEIVNVTDKLFALDGLKVVEYELSDPTAYDDFVDITDTKRYLLPNVLYVLTEDPTVIEEQYEVEHKDNLIDVAIPNFSNVEGIVGILNEQLVILDKLEFSANWHFEALNRQDGVSLERLSKTRPTQDKTNWYSASVVNGGATPTAENSQKEGTSNQTDSELILSSEIFSPDNDGLDDFLEIRLKQNQQGMTGSIYVYNVRGYLVKTVVNNQILGNENQIRWTGLDDDDQPLPIGHYIIVANFYDEDGKESTIKEKVVLSRRR